MKIFINYVHDSRGGVTCPIEDKVKEVCKFPAGRQVCKECRDCMLRNKVKGYYYTDSNGLRLHYEKTRTTADGKGVPIKADKKPKRNDKCTCGSGKKYKKCCLSKET